MDLPRQFVSSMFKIEAYRYFFRQSLGRAFLYLFFISVILAGLSGIKPLVNYCATIDEMVLAMNTDAPHFELHNGELTMDAAMPYIIDQSADYFFAVDTTGQLDGSVLDNYQQGILITKHGWFQKQNAYRLEQYSFKSLGNISITKDDVIEWLPMLKWFSLLIIFFGFIFYFCGKLLSALIIGAGGLIFAGTAKTKIGFGNLYKLSIYTLTLPMVLKALLNIVEVTVPLFWVFYYGIALIYLFRAITILNDRKGDITGLNR
ncbi:MAG: DUF1189 domain-containing protein [Bacillota bacterium]